MSPPRLWLSAVAFLLLAGCSVFNREPLRYETIAGDPNHDTDEAHKQNEAALKLIDKCDYEAAEQKLQKALIADVSFGPAHNNLGHIYFEQGKLYLAAWEFEYATRLMPEQASPHNNLGLIYEQVGRISEAIQHFQTALQLSAGNVEIMANLARARIRQGERSPETATLLNELALRDDRPEWREWALEQLNTKQLDMLPLNSVSRPMDWPLGIPLPEEPVDGGHPPIPNTAPPAEEPLDFNAPTTPVPPAPEAGPRLNSDAIEKMKTLSRWKSARQRPTAVASQ